MLCYTLMAASISHHLSLNVCLAAMQCKEMSHYEISELKQNQFARQTTVSFELIGPILRKKSNVKFTWVRIHIFLTLSVRL